MSTNGENSKSKRPAMTAFKQQQLRAWQPILTPLPVILTFLVVGAIFIPVGIALLFASRSVQEHTVRYDDTCGTNTTCSVNMTLNQPMKPPVYLYYRLDNFYQNHRRYVKSRSDKALQGTKITDVADLSTCDPLVNNGTGGIASSYFPCGLIAGSFFNDSFTMSSVGGAGSTSLRKEGIAWSSDVKSKFGNISQDAGQGILPPNLPSTFYQTDEDFIVWMRTAGLPNFRKLYRIIDGPDPLQPGDYTFNITNYFPVQQFSGKKYLVLSTTSWIGGKNDFLGWAFIAVGVVCIVQSIAFTVKHRLSPRKLGDTKYLDWNK